MAEVFMVISIGEMSAECGNTENDVQAVDPRMIACGDLTTPFGIDDINAITRQINMICSNVECSLSCMDTVIGNCDTTNDFYVMYNKKTYRASYRGLCADTTGATNAFTGCADAMVAAVSSCRPSYESAISQIVKYLHSGNGALFKQTACSDMARLATCFNLSPTGTCTSTYADLVYTFYKTLLTFDTCGHPTTNQWFQDYSGPVNITGLTCGISVVAPSTICLAAMACFVALIKYMHT